LRRARDSSDWRTRSRSCWSRQIRDSLTDARALPDSAASPLCRPYSQTADTRHPVWELTYDQ
jgi:hypothetical protein